ncbi:MAG: biosynthetic-type acetolactate synthase large subunit, partial [bacterium]
IEGLQRAGVKTMFGLPGGTVLDFFAKLAHAPMEFFLVRHEQGATHMADGYARATGKAGVCLVTSGPGATNAVTGLATANMDGSPVVCISGQVPSPLIGNDAFQEADTVGITRAVTKHNYLVKNVDDLPRIMVEAFEIATSGKPGPVLVDVPKDIQQARCDLPFPTEMNRRGYRPENEPDAQDVERLARAITTARRPVFLVGGGVISGDATAEFTAVALKTGVPVVSTLMGLGAFPGNAALALGMIGMHGTVAANRAASACDLIVSVGARFDDRVTGKVSTFAPHALKGHIDIDPSAIGKSVQVDLPVVGHVKIVLRQLLEAVESVARPEWLAQVADWKETNPLTYDRASKELLPQYVIEQIAAVTHGDALIVTDVGQHQMWAAHFYPYSKPRSFITSGGLGTMGFGLPAAIGVKAARRDQPVVLISGDGSIQMNFQELVVAVEHDLPIVVVILNNGYLGMVRQWQELFYKREYSGVRLGRDARHTNERISATIQAAGPYRPDFVKLAEAHGAMGIRVTRQEEVAPALVKALNAGLPVVVECIVRAEENVYPIVPPGKALSELLQGLA